jgi:hypothetical protein
VPTDRLGARGAIWGCGLDQTQARVGQQRGGGEKRSHRSAACLLVRFLACVAICLGPFFCSLGWGLVSGVAGVDARWMGEWEGGDDSRSKKCQSRSDLASPPRWSLGSLELRLLRVALALLLLGPQAHHARTTGSAEPSRLV